MSARKWNQYGSPILLIGNTRGNRLEPEQKEKRKEGSYKKIDCEVTHSRGLLQLHSSTRKGVPAEKYPASDTSTESNRFRYVSLGLPIEVAFIRSAFHGLLMV